MSSTEFRIEHLDGVAETLTDVLRKTSESLGEALADEMLVSQLRARTLAYVEEMLRDGLEAARDGRADIAYERIDSALLRITSCRKEIRRMHDERQA